MFLDKLNWRYATKAMDPSKPVDEAKLAQIVEAIRMAPTSSGLQPFHLFVIRHAVERPGSEAALDTYYDTLKASYLPRPVRSRRAPDLYCTGLCACCCRRA